MRFIKDGRIAEWLVECYFTSTETIGLLGTATSTFTQLLSSEAEWLCARTNIGPRLCAGEEAVRGGDGPHPAGTGLQQHGSQTPRAADGRAGAQNCCRESRIHCSPVVSLSLSVCLLAGLRVGLSFRLFVGLSSSLLAGLSVCLSFCSFVCLSV